MCAICSARGPNISAPRIAQLFFVEVDVEAPDGLVHHLGAALITPIACADHEPGAARLQLAVRLAHHADLRLAEHDRQGHLARLRFRRTAYGIETGDLAAGGRFVEQRRVIHRIAGQKDAAVAAPAGAAVEQRNTIVVAHQRGRLQSERADIRPATDRHQRPFEGRGERPAILAVLDGDVIVGAVDGAHLVVREEIHRCAEMVARRGRHRLVRQRADGAVLAEEPHPDAEPGQRLPELQADDAVAEHCH